MCADLPEDSEGHWIKRTVGMCDVPEELRIATPKSLNDEFDRIAAKIRSDIAKNNTRDKEKALIGLKKHNSKEFKK